MTFMGFMESTGSTFDDLRRNVSLKIQGRVTSVTGPVIRAKGVDAVLGSQVDLWRDNEAAPIPAEVVGLADDQVLLMCLGSTEGIGPGSVVSPRGNDPTVPMGNGLLGRIIDGLGNPLDGGPCPRSTIECRYGARPPTPWSARVSIRRFPPESAPWMPC